MVDPAGMAIDADHNEFLRLDAEACEKVAALLSSMKIPLDEEDRRLNGFTDHEVGNFYLLLVAICHQTQTLIGEVNGQSYRGWDYLSRKLEQHARTDRGLLSPQRWQTMGEDDIRALFRDSQDRETLTDPAGRAKLVQDLGNVMAAKEWILLSDLVRAAEGRIEVGSPTVLGLLAHFRAYQDPVRKKSYFLLGLMANNDVFRFVDPENLGSPVDYHEVRGHLRLGTVVVQARSLHDKLLSGADVTQAEDIAIRGAVSAAIRAISRKYSLPNPMVLHYLFWNIFRHVCVRQEPHCKVPPGHDTQLPKRYRHLLCGNGDTETCPFVLICRAVQASHRYLEHRFATEWY